MEKPENITKTDWKILQRKYQNLEPIVKKINSGYPIQYLIGDVDFLGNQILVNEDVLIPRFETETLVDKTINYIQKLKFNNASLLEIGTGSGCISISIKKAFKNINITATDISNKALNIAKKNAKLNKVKIYFINKDLFKLKLINKYDILISNPPYLIKGEKIDLKTKYEPSVAIYADKTGLNFYTKIFELATEVLNKKFLIALEVDENRGAEIKQLASKFFPNTTIKLEKDLSKKVRYLFIYTE
ncbi:MAG: peptide chain release factor N(5)-glutamine methyltransferase [Bacilli bacterium]|nr:peptide chain release factor N(5)-glutamine methyltransferase [Bacilli bacterium]